MRSAYIALLVLISLALTLRCSGTTTREVWVLDFDLEERTGRFVSFRVHSEWSNGCGEVSGFSSRLEGNRYLVRMFGEQPTHAMCTDNMKPISGVWRTRAPAPGKYTFSFRHEGAPLDTTIVFE
jgi:hypothetical protein